jgi:hypothetical protein
MRYALIALALCVSSWPVSASARPSTVATIRELTAAQWREDLRFMAAEMRRRHANLYHHVSKADFDAAVEDLDKRIPQLQRNQVIVGMMRIAALVGDGHTRIEPRKDKAFGFASLPLRLYWFEEGVFVRAAAPTQASLVGARVEAVGGVPIEEAIRRVSVLASRENTIGPKLYVPIYLGMPDVLQAVGLSSDRSSATLTVSKSGRKWSIRVPVGEVAELWPADTDASFFTPNGWIDARRTPKTPLWLQAPLDYHRLVELPEQRALYAQLNMVTDKDDQTLTQFGERIAERARAMNPRTIILDLRLSQGGNGDLRQGFLRSLIRAEDSDSRLIVLTARGTFSASQFILDDLDRLTDAILIGEPASSRPTGYGDAFRSTLPNSGIAVRTSIKYWQSGQDMRDWTPVDVAAPLTFADYSSGRDTTLEAALAYRPRSSLASQVEAASKRNEGSPAESVARAWVDDPVNRFAYREGVLIDAIVELQGREKNQEALSLARWSAQHFPNSTDLASLHASIAEAAGLKEEAVRAGYAAMKNDPNNRFARSLLQRLGEGVQ